MNLTNKKGALPKGDQWSPHNWEADVLDMIYLLDKWENKLIWPVEHDCYYHYFWHHAVQKIPAVSCDTVLCRLPKNQIIIF